MWILGTSPAEVIDNFWQLLWQMATDGEENLPEETGVEEKANSVRSLDEDDKCPITMTGGDNLGFFLQQTDTSLEEL